MAIRTPDTCRVGPAEGGGWREGELWLFEGGWLLPSTPFKKPGRLPIPEIPTLLEETPDYGSGGPVNQPSSSSPESRLPVSTPAILPAVLAARSSCRRLMIGASSAEAFSAAFSFTDLVFK